MEGNFHKIRSKCWTKMYNFVKRLLFFLLFLTCIFGGIYTCNLIMFKTVICRIPVDKTNLLVGHSHVAVSLDPSIVKHSIHATIGAQPLFLSYIKLRYLLRQNTHVEKVLLGFSPHDFSEYQDTKLIKKKKAVHFFDRFIPILPLSELIWPTFDKKIFYSLKNIYIV